MVVGLFAFNQRCTTGSTQLLGCDISARELELKWGTFENERLEWLFQFLKADLIQFYYSNWKCETIQAKLFLFTIKTKLRVSHVFSVEFIMKQFRSTILLLICKPVGFGSNWCPQVLQNVELFFKMLKNYKRGNFALKGSAISQLKRPKVFSGNSIISEEPEPCGPKKVFFWLKWKED